MPDFLSSLLKSFTDVNGNAGTRDDLALSSDGLTIIISEHSNYVDSTESGHLQAAFTILRKVIVTDDNNSVYTFSSITGDGDALIDPGSAGNYILSYTPEAGDSLYTARSISVPTWDNTAAYQTDDDCVVMLVSSVAKVYKAIQDSVGQDPETQSAYWTEVTDLTLLPVKYNVVGHVAVARAIQTQEIKSGLAAKEKFAAESFTSVVGNKLFVQAATLNSIIKGIIYYVSIGAWDTVSAEIAKGKEAAAKDCTV